MACGLRRAMYDDEWMVTMEHDSFGMRDRSWVGDGASGPLKNNIQSRMDRTAKGELIFVRRQLSVLASQ